MSVGFIYPMWMSAKMNLIDALYARKKDSEIFEIVDAWMKRHFFELGITTQVDAMDLYKNEEEFEKHIKYMAARKLSDEILKTNLYMREIVSNRPKSKYAYHHPERIYTYTMIVGGVPLLTGPGTREAKLLKIEDAFSPSVSPPLTETKNKWVQLKGKIQSYGGSSRLVSAQRVERGASERGKGAFKARQGIPSFRTH